ncbi:MAG: hypothetical protein V9H69_19675 [Anaerolineae bacterium]
MEAFPSLDELLLNPVVAAAAVVAAVNVVSYAAGGVKPTWLALTVALGYMVGGYLVTGRTAPDQLFLAVGVRAADRRAAGPRGRRGAAPAVRPPGQPRNCALSANRNGVAWFQEWL